MTPGLLIEALIIVLLIATIGYCALLSSRLKRLKSDESALRSTIAELLTATELAERAIKGLKKTASDNQKSLGVQIQTAEGLTSELQTYVTQGNGVVEKLALITQAAVQADAQTTLPAPIPANAHQPVHAQISERQIRRPSVRPQAALSNARVVSDLASQASARISAIRNQGA